MSKNDESRGFLNRWSARKQQANEGEQHSLPEFEPLSESSLKSGASAGPLLFDDGLPSDLPAASPTDEGESTLLSSAESTAELATAETDELVLGDADMPPIETLTSDSDISGFFSKGVSAALRKAALRHVFQQPSYNVRDGLNDYDGDFTKFESLGDTITADMKFHVARKEKARLEEERLAAEQAELEERRKLLAAEQEEEAAGHAEGDQQGEADGEEPQAVVEDESELSEDNDAHADASAPVSVPSSADMDGDAEAGDARQAAALPSDKNTWNHTALPDDRQPRDEAE